ncbi:MAG TPA: hypothetical protein DDZ81_08460 [Acetobacteraceae bacterium]|jgi:hypothetical protein|nr:hypothetical protein [Acetobacteraceae bacterium]
MIFPEPDYRGPPSACNGFVVAMRSKLIGSGRPCSWEWLIVSRWGGSGEHLSIGWTSTPAPTAEAPLSLTPRQTAFAICAPGSGTGTPATFHFAACLPQRLTVAGDFVPAHGCVRLYGSGTALRVRSKGICLDPGLRPAWDVEAARGLWVGEFIEGQPVRSTQATASMSSIEMWNGPIRQS